MVNFCCCKVLFNTCIPLVIAQWGVGSLNCSIFVSLLFFLFLPSLLKQSLNFDLFLSSHLSCTLGFKRYRKALSRKLATNYIHNKYYKLFPFQWRIQDFLKREGLNLPPPPKKKNPWKANRQGGIQTRFNPLNQSLLSIFCTVLILNVTHIYNGSIECNMELIYS